MEQFETTAIQPNRPQNFLSNTWKRVTSVFAALVDVGAYRTEMARYERELGHRNGQSGER